MKEIPLTKGAIAIVDDEDFSMVDAYSWHTTEKGYAATTANVGGERKIVRMHRLIMGLRAGDGLQVDHINGDRTDNRRCNLRVCTSAENNRNRQIAGVNTSGIKGVHWDKVNKVWRAQIHIDGRNKTVGRFPDKEQARQAYIQAAKQLHGEFFCDRSTKEVTHG